MEIDTNLTPQSLVIWDDDVKYIQARAQAMHEKLVSYVWSHASLAYQRKRVTSHTGTSSCSSSRHTSPTVSPQKKKHSKRHSFFYKSQNEKLVEKEEYDEKADSKANGASTDISHQHRKPNYLIAFYTGLAVAIDLLLCGLFARRLLVESLLSDSYLRMAILVCLPFMVRYFLTDHADSTEKSYNWQFAVALFFSFNMVTIVAMILAPIRQMKENSLYYSGEAPKRLRKNLPHMTVSVLEASCWAISCSLDSVFRRL